VLDGLVSDTLETAETDISPNVSRNVAT